MTSHTEKAWVAKHKVPERRFSTYEASYDNLPRLLGFICSRNEGSYYDNKTIPSDSGSATILQRDFFTLGPFISAFQYGRPILCIDGTIPGQRAMTGRPSLSLIELVLPKMWPNTARN
jgi:hypothetical protein